MLALSANIVNRKREFVPFIFARNLSALPDGRTVLYAIHHDGRGVDTIAVFDGARQTVILTLEGERLRSPVYAPTGHILYYQETSSPGIWAVPFSLSSLECTGTPRVIVPDATYPSVAADGTLVYSPGALTALWQLAGSVGPECSENASATRGRKW